MRFHRHLLTYATVLTVIIGLTAAPADAAPKPVSFAQVTATLLPFNQVRVELTVKCEPSDTYQFQIFHVLQGETAGWNDDPTFLPTPCGTREILPASGLTGLFEPGKAQLHALVNICEGGDPAACSVAEVWKTVRLRT